MRRAGLVAATVVLALAAVVGVLAFFNARDDATIGNDANAPGRPADDATGRTLRQGNVVLLYGDPAERAALRALADDVAGPQDPALVHAGQAILVQRRAGTRGVVAMAYRRRLQARDAEDPLLREFAEFWLGRASLPE